MPRTEAGNRRQFDYNPRRVLKSPCYGCDPKEALRIRRADVDAMRNLLVRGNNQERSEFLRYYQWCLDELEECGRDLERALGEMGGRFDDEFSDLMNEQHQYEEIKRFDASSSKARERWVELKRKLTGNSQGIPPEKGKDLVSLRWQSSAYIVWFCLQAVRVVLNGISLDKQIKAEDGYWFGNPNTNHSKACERTGAASVVPDALALAQLGITVCTFVPFLIHAMSQFREYDRGIANRELARMGVLNCMAGAIKFMTTPGPATSVDANAYRMAIVNWKKYASPIGKHDVRRYEFSFAREIAFPFNLFLSSLTAYNLVSGQTAIRLLIASGLIQAAGGGFALVGAVSDIGQGRSEILSAAKKLRKAREHLRNAHDLNSLLIDVASDEEEIAGTIELKQNIEGAFNRAFIQFQERRVVVQKKEKYVYGVGRFGKGALNVFSALAAIAFGGVAVATCQTSPPAALLFATLSTAISGAYYAFTWTKMEPLRNREKNLIKRLHLEAQYMRLVYRPDQLRLIVSRSATLMLAKYKSTLRQNLQQSEAASLRTLERNELLLLHLLTEDVLKELSATAHLVAASPMKTPGGGSSKKPDASSFREPLDTVAEALKSNAVKWMVKNAGVSKLRIEAVLRAVCDKAEAFRYDFIKQGLAELMEIELPVRRDKMERRVPAWLMVSAKLEIMEAGLRKMEPNPSGWQIWNRFRGPLLRGTTMEEFISGVLHAVQRVKLPDPELSKDKHLALRKLQDVALAALYERLNQLNAVSDPQRAPASLRKITRCNDDDIDQFQVLVREYAAIDIHDRGEQLKALEKLAKDPLMQSLVSKAPVYNFRRLKHPTLALGILHLAVRVDLYDVIHTSIPSSPVAQPKGGATVTTVVPSGLLDTREESVPKPTEATESVISTAETTLDWENSDDNDDDNVQPKHKKKSGGQPRKKLRTMQTDESTRSKSVAKWPSTKSPSTRTTIRDADSDEEEARVEFAWPAKLPDKTAVIRNEGTSSRDSSVSSDPSRSSSPSGSRQPEDDSYSDTDDYSSGSESETSDSDDESSSSEASSDSN